jgi:hypothetical protein
VSVWLRLFAASVFCGVILPPVGARAEPAWRSRLAWTIDARGEIGPGEVAGIDLGLVGVGIEWRATPTLRLRAEALLLGATGTTAAGISAQGGAGGELGARVVPFPRWPLRPYLRASAGTLLFPRAPFLPEGDVYDFILQLGAGLEIPVGTRLALFGDVQAVHLSNGQGLGPYNPAFTGEGVLVGAAYALAPPAPSSNASSDDSSDDSSNASSDASSDAFAGETARLPAVDEARPNWAPGATFDAEVGNADGSLLLGARDRVAQRLSRHTLALMDIESGSIDGSHFLEAGLDLAGHWTRASAGVHSGYRHFVGTGTFVEQAQLEANVSPEATLVAMGEWDIPSLGADTLRAAAILRLFPIETFVIELGGRYNRIGGTPANSSVAPYFGLEWQLLPFKRGSWQASLFLERQAQSLQLVGARFSWDMGSTLLDIARRTGWRRLR